MTNYPRKTDTTTTFTSIVDLFPKSVFCLSNLYFLLYFMVSIIVHQTNLFVNYWTIFNIYFNRWKTNGKFNVMAVLSSLEQDLIDSLFNVKLCLGWSSSLIKWVSQRAKLLYIEWDRFSGNSWNSHSHLLILPIV